ncbi:probable aspartic protease At2g35615 [Ziziphus jujuba]|uniref:Probable aspartic protease At2g35615 n=1 Tax=Ziziphus jujuba TaxID=326968 RepID=A0A6P6GKF7_ZIZJJ|nr:probable aspartic protease At2g35615 [Ziziphus jujuba]
MAAIFSSRLLLFFLFTELINVSFAAGFSIDLIQRDCPLSPLYDPSVNHFDRLHSAFRRSFSRIHRYNPQKYSTLDSPSSSIIQSTIIPGSGEYFMNISIGTPPVEVLGIADTGSDLIWTQCKPCTQCFMQDPPLFDPKKSSTYRSIPCDSSSCSKLSSQATCGSVENSCQYSYSYGDRSFTRGNLAAETMTFGGTHHHPVSIPSIVLGCGHENGGTFDESGSGLIGLGGGSLSLVSQLSKSVGGKVFSYCLVPLSDQSLHTSKITFGNSPSAKKSAISTPLVAKDPETFYYVTLEAISVGEKRLHYKNSSSKVAAEKGNIILDSGTTLTFLPSGFFEDLVTALEEAINAERVSDPSGMLSLCFKVDDGDEQIPTITAHFSGGDVVLQPLNTFAKMEDDMFCLTMVASEEVAIFGNMAQMNFFVEYDLDKETVSFMPTECTKH